MTEREAIAAINKEYESFLPLSTSSDFDTAMAVSIKALEELALYKEGGLCLVPADTFEKQRPVIHKGYYGCKKCGVIKSMRQKNNYCHYCGKGFDWENPERMEEV